MGQICLVCSLSRVARSPVWLRLKILTTHEDRRPGQLVFLTFFRVCILQIYWPTDGRLLYSYRIYQVQKEVGNSSYWTTALACQNSVRQCSRYAQDIIKQYAAYQLTAYSADASTKTSFCKLSQETTFSLSINELWGSHKPTTFARIEHHKCFMC